MFRKMGQPAANITAMLGRAVAGEQNTIQPIGSAFVCHSKGYLLTCAHTVRLTDKLLIVATDDAQFVPITRQVCSPARVEIVQYDATNDVALLKILDSDTSVMLPHDAIAPDSFVPELGSSCAYAGYPFSDRQLHVCHVATSMISARVLSAKGTKQYQLDAMVHEGCSGGPLFDVASGKIIGVVAGRFSPIGSVGAGVLIGGRPAGTDSMISYATSIQYAKELMQAEGLHV